MTNFNRSLLCLLFALFSCWLTTAGSTPPGDIGRAGVIMPEEGVFSDLRTDHAAVLPHLLASRQLFMFGKPQLNGRLAKGKFLVASQQMKDPRFMEAVILLVQHDSNGSLGLIINRPTTAKLSDLLPELKEPQGREHVAYIGGPVGLNQVFLLIRSQSIPEGCERIFDDVCVSVSRGVLDQLIKKSSGKETFRAYAGYAGWAAGQLEREVLMGGWKIAEADAETIFRKPASEIWQNLNREEEETEHIDI